jgi:hypothetical protein
VKLHEIVFGSSIEYERKQIEATSVFFADAKRETVEGDWAYLKKEEGETLWVGLERQNKLKGWAGLKRVTIAGEAYLELKMLFVVPEARGTKALPLLLFCAKEKLKLPIVLGTDERGGTLFKGGFELVKSLLSRGDTILGIAMLDLETGERSKTPADLKSLSKDTGMTLVFEHLALSFELPGLPVPVAPGSMRWFFDEASE